MSLMGFDEFSPRWIARRKPEDTPLDPRCKPALRRICGVCTHFGGTLKDHGARPCAALMVDKRARSCAAKCRRFERKTAP